MGAYTRLHSLAKLDGRRKEAWLMARVREELTAHVGGNPSVSQRLLIERAAILTLRLSLLDQKIVDGEPLTQHDNNYVIAWNRTLTRLLTTLGLEAANSAPPRLSDILAKEDVA